jgi:hypothetical protein
VIGKRLYDGSMAMRQRGKSDCFIAAIAHATGNSYSAVKRKFGGLERGGARPSEITWLLGEFAGYRVARIRKPAPKAAEWAAKHSRVKAVLIVGVNGFWGGSDHVISAINGTLHDPGAHADGGGAFTVLAAYIVR